MCLLGLRMVDILVPARFLRDSGLTDEATRGVRMDRMARQLAACLDNLAPECDRLRKEDIFSLKVVPSSLPAN